MVHSMGDIQPILNHGLMSYFALKLAHSFDWKGEIMAKWKLSDVLALFKRRFKSCKLIHTSEDGEEEEEEIYILPYSWYKISLNLSMKVVLRTKDKLVSGRMQFQ